jgi:hypothetical protein
MAHHPCKAPLVDTEPPLVQPLRDCIEAALPLALLGAEEPAGQHRRESERHEAGDQNRYPDGHGKLVEQLPDDPAHEQDRDEHRGERQRHRENGEADLGAAVDGGLQLRFSHLQMANDVFEHHDGVVHHEAHGQGERHEGEIIQAITEQIHHREGPDDGHRQGQARDHRGGQVPQKQEDHHHHQRQRELESERHVMH